MTADDLDRAQIVERVQQLEREHFREPCHPERCSHYIYRAEPHVSTKDN